MELTPENIQTLLMALGVVIVAVLGLWAAIVKLTPKKEDDKRFLKVTGFLKGFLPKSMKSKVEDIEKNIEEPK
jgi:hypothetical protein